VLLQDGFRTAPYWFRSDQKTGNWGQNELAGSETAGSAEDLRVNFGNLPVNGKSGMEKPISGVFCCGFSGWQGAHSSCIAALSTSTGRMHYAVGQGKDYGEADETGSLLPL
jgi:hypothetical protein